MPSLVKHKGVDANHETGLLPRGGSHDNEELTSGVQITMCEGERLGNISSVDGG